MAPKDGGITQKIPSKTISKHSPEAYNADGLEIPRIGNQSWKNPNGKIQTLNSVEILEAAYQSIGTI